MYLIKNEILPFITTQMGVEYYAKQNKAVKRKANTV